MTAHARQLANARKARWIERHPDEHRRRSREGMRKLYWRRKAEKAERLAYIRLLGERLISGEAGG